VLTGLAFWIFAASYGLELQREWGVIAFVPNFIPFIGSFVGTLLPTLFAAAQFESLYAALIVFIALNILQFVIGSYIEPRVTGTAVSVFPFMVLFRGILLGHALGCGRRFYRRADPDRARNCLRRAGCNPPDRGAALIA
jgi:predicted PurR-regulated permease PerM